MDSWRQLSEAEQARYHTIDSDNLEFIMNRYNRINRWVIADMLRRSRYRFPDKPALIFGNDTLTYSALDDDCNRVANSLLELGVERYDRVAILAHNTIHHVLTWFGCCKPVQFTWRSIICSRGRDIAYCINHSESKVFIVEDALYDSVKDVLAEMPT